MEKIAQIISIVLGPIIWPVFIIILVLKSRLSNDKAIFILFILLFFQVFIPYFYIFLKYKLKKISDLDITERKQRHNPMIITSISFLISLIFVYFLGNYFLIKILIMTFLIMIINTIITFFWKISLHMTINIIFSILVNYLFNWKFSIIYLTIPLIFWSRLYLKKHTINQLLGALILNGTIVIIFIFFVF